MSLVNINQVKLPQKHRNKLKDNTMYVVLCLYSDFEYKSDLNHILIMSCRVRKNKKNSSFIA